MNWLISLVLCFFLVACASPAQKPALTASAAQSSMMPPAPVHTEKPKRAIGATAAKTGTGVQDLSKKQLPVEYRKALALMMQKNWVEAEKLLLTFSSESSMGEAVFANLAIVAVEREQWDQALQWIDKALQIKKTAELFNIRGVALRQLGQFTDAARSYQQAIALEPQQARYYYNLGILYDIYLQDLDKARENYKHYLALNNDNDKIVRGWMQDLQHRAQASN